jgi:hypothetical protein
MLRLTLKADWERQQRAQPGTVGSLEQRVIEPWPRVARHLQTNREIDAGAGRDSYSARQEPKAARMDPAIGFGDQIAPHKADLSRGGSVVLQAGTNFASAAEWHGALGAQDGQGLDRVPPQIGGRAGHGGRWWRRCEKVKHGVQQPAEPGRQPTRRLRSEEITMMRRPHLARSSDIGEGAMLDLIAQDRGRPLSERCCTHNPA